MNCFSSPSCPAPPTALGGSAPHASKLFPTLPPSPRAFGFAQRPAPRRPGSAESPPPGRSAFSLRVCVASRKPGSEERQVEVSQLSVSFSLSNQTSGLQSAFLSTPSLSFASDSKSLRPSHHPQQFQTYWCPAKGRLHFALKSL